MGLDGFSMGNLGLHRDLTSAQMANQADILATKGLEFKIQDVGQLASNKGIERREGGIGAGGGGSSKKDEEEEEEQEDPREEELSRQKQREIESQDPKEFSVRVNPDTDMVELINNKSNKIVETISANDLMVLISRLDSASGILVNRKI